jgi:hypothetical protein
MNIIASSADRVTLNSSAMANERIRRRTHNNIIRAVRLGRRGIERRLAELDEEWDIERLGLLGCLLGTTKRPVWFLLPAGVAAFLLQHALQGWCPPLPVLRRLGFRTADEINIERFALKVLRGDFEALPPEHGIALPRLVLEAAER